MSHGASTSPRRLNALLEYTNGNPIAGQRSRGVMTDVLAWQGGGAGARCRYGARGRQEEQKARPETIWPASMNAEPIPVPGVIAATRW